MKLIALFFLTSANLLAQDWTFSTPSDTNRCVVNVGAFGTGWYSNQFDAQGWWDVGQFGRITVQADASPEVSQTVRIEATTWLDGGIYPDPVVELAGGTWLSATQTCNPVVQLGAWQTFTSEWAVTPTNSFVTATVRIDHPQRGLLVDRIKVTTSTPPKVSISPVAAVQVTWPADRALEQSVNGGAWQSVTASPSCSNGVNNLLIQSESSAMFRLK